MTPNLPTPRTSDEQGVMDIDNHQGCFGEDLVRLIATSSGFICGKPERDLGDGLDLLVNRAQNDGLTIRPPTVGLQVKTVRNPRMVADGSQISYDLSVKHYDSLRLPGGDARYLVVVVVPGADSGHWVGHGQDFQVFHQGAYWVDLLGEPAAPGSSFKSVRVPLRQRYTRDAVHLHMRQARERQNQLFGLTEGGD